MLADTIIKKAIAEVAAVAEKFPAVVIIHDLRDWRVAWMSQTGLKQLNTSLEEIKAFTAEQYYATYFNAEDAGDYVPKILGLLEKNNNEDICTFFQQVRFMLNGDWSWHLSSVKILARDNDNKPLLTITSSFPIDSMHHIASKASKILEENNFLRQNFQTYSKLTKREIDVLKYFALGKSAAETAEMLFISTLTVETHRRTIRKKLNTSSFSELVQYARSFDLI